MSISSSRPFAAPAYPSSPAPTTASSVSYSQYGSGSFTSPPRGPVPNVAGGRPPLQSNGSSQRSMMSGGLRPPGGGGGERRMESREVARVHWRALREFLASWLETESPTARASAREKLTKLTKLQFQELSTDVYDELMRRRKADSGGGDVPFLPVREDFHPKRNQARQKLATLPNNRFKDLASDVFFELRRRYPEFEEGEVSISQRRPGSNYDEPPPAPGPRRPSLSQQPSNPTMTRLNSSTSLHQRQQSNMSAGSSGSSHRPRPSRGNTQEMLVEPRQAATSEVVIPNKSRMREEEIEVPYARDSQVIEQRSSRTSSPDPRDSRSSLKIPPQMLSPQTEDGRDYYDRMSFSSNVTNKSKALVQGGSGWDEEREQKIRAEYEFRIAGLERRAQVAENERDEARRGEGAEREQRREWEDEVRGLKERSGQHASSLRSIQHELDLARDAADTARRHGEETTRQMEDEVRHWRDQCDRLEDELNRGASGNRDDNSDMVGELKDEVRSLLNEINALSIRNDELMAERDRDKEELAEMETKMGDYKRKYDAVRIELRNLKATSTMFVAKPASDDHLPASADGNIADVNVSSFQAAIDGLLAAARSSVPSGVLPAMKAIVEAVTEIGEDVKAFEARPNLDVDVSRLESLKHESTTRLNNLMQAARNHAMASGLSPVSLIDAAAGHLSANVVEIIKLLKIRRSEKLREIRRSRSNLSIRDMVNRGDGGAARANGSFDRDYGDRDREEKLDSPQARVMSPISISSNGPNSAMSNGSMPFSARSQTTAPPSARSQPPTSAPPLPTRNNSSLNEPPQAVRINSFQSVTSSGQKSDSFDLERNASVASYSRPVVQSNNDDRRSVGSNSELTSASSAVAPVTANGFDVDEQEDERGGTEQEWEELKPYLNNQSSLLVNSIQNLLAAIRTGGQTPALNEHLSEVIAIASSIVAVASNSLPAPLRPQGDVLLRELVSNTNKLSEAQDNAKGVFEKATRQGIASASFGVAKGLKSLMKLGQE
ncbi:hypothetical protein BCR39DRAFT_582805 [Naematelia encephala]|uniref:GIT Spa2 homology (SHD) domain-containing protein n=1 Tax=Naematelia encephala TaxID=71784 RepID=A0A1Y2AM15_9TREE|nr:hypothetical protein BCR39DRAFT_582805 [Naematelia encephala]